MSVGEALRRVDQEDIIKTDFVLVSGDCIANMNLRRAVEHHRARRERNKNSIMTMVLRRTTSALARERLAERPLVVTLDSADRVLGYQHIDPARRKSNHVAVEAHVFSERDDVQVWMLGIVRCSLVVHVPACAAVNVAAVNVAAGDALRPLLVAAVIATRIATISPICHRSAPT